MPRRDRHDDTTDDYERFETERIAQDRDAARISTADIGEETARQLAYELLDTGDVTPVADQRVLVHEPSGEAFTSMHQLAVFHRGWTAGRDAGCDEP